MAQVAMAAIAIGTTGYSMWQAHETEQEQTAALNKQQALQQKALMKKKETIIANQKASLLASGISLDSGLADVMEKDTLLASREESNLISDYYSTQIRSVKRSTKAAYAQGIGNIATSALSMRSTYGSVPSSNGTVNQTTGAWISPTGQNFNYRGS